MREFYATVITGLAFPVQLEFFAFNVTRATSAQKYVVEDDILFINHLAGKWEIPSLALTSASTLNHPCLLGWL